MPVTSVQGCEVMVIIQIEWIGPWISQIVPIPSPAILPILGPISIPNIGLVHP